MHEWHRTDTSRSPSAAARIRRTLASLSITGLLFSCAGTGLASTVPFTENFNYADGVNIDGSNDWSVAGGGEAIVTNSSLSLTDISVSNSFTDAEESVSITFELQPRFSASSPTVPADAVFAFYVWTNGTITAYDGTSESNLSQTALSESTTNTIRVDIDYQATNWSLTVDGDMVATNFDFYAETSTSFSEVGFVEASTSTSYIDSVEIETPPLAYFDLASAAYAESAGTITVTARLSSTYGSTVTVVHAVSGGTATGADYENYTSDTLVFDPGETNAAFTFDIVDDSVGEGPETIIFGLSNYTNALAGVPATFTATILEDLSDWTIPFTEDFESRTLGDLDGQNGWQATDAAVQDTTYRGTQAGSVTTETAIAKHPFGDGETNVWTDLWVQAVFGDTSVSNPPAGSSFAFYVNASSNVVVYNGSTTQAVGTALTAGDWARFTVHSDYYNTNWNLYVDGVQVATNLDFYDSGATDYTEFGVRGAGASTAPFDDVAITVDPPPPLASFVLSSNSFTEGYGTATGDVALSWASAGTVEVDVEVVVGGTADGGDVDYTFSTTTLTFTAGTTNLPFTFAINDDSEGEVAETIFFGLANYSGCTAGATTSFTATIEADPVDIPGVSFTTDAMALTESSGTVTAIVQLTSAYNIGTVEVDYNVTGGDAVYGEDYTNFTSGTFSFAPGETTTNFTFEIINDTSNELAETIVFGLSGFSFCTPGTHTQLTATIGVDVSDEPPEVLFASASDSVAESAGSVEQTVYLSKTYSGTVTVDVEDKGTGSATGSGDDYTFSTASLTFVPGDTNETFSVTIEEDSDGEEAETIDFGFANIVNASAGAPSSYTVTIQDDGSDWSLPFSETFETGGDMADSLGALNGQHGWIATDAVVQDSVKRDLQAGSVTSETAIARHPFGGGETNVWTDFWIQPVFGDNSSTNPPDGSTFAFYVNESSNIVVYSGSTTQAVGSALTEGQWVHFTVNSDYANTNWDLYVNDVLVAEDLDFYQTSSTSYSEFGIRGAGSSNAPVDDVSITLAPPSTVQPEVSFALASDSFAESDGTVTGQVVLSSVYAGTAEVDVEVTGGTADGGGVDYTFATATLTFTTGITTQDFTFAINDDNDGENPETIIFGLSSYSNCSAGATTSYTATIEADASDVPGVSFSTNVLSFAESAGTVTCTVELTTAYAIGPIEVDYSVTGGNLVFGSDYTSYADGTLTIAAGETSSNFTFEIINDSSNEPAETIVFGLDNFVTGTPGTYTQLTCTVEADGSDWSLPFTETFESRTLGDLAGQNGWQATDAIVQDQTARDTQAGSVTSETGVARHPFNDGKSNVWTDVWIQPVFGEGHDSVTNPPTGCSFAFYVNTSSNAVAFDGTSETQLTATVTEGVWTRFTVYSDYDTKEWDLYLNGGKIADGLQFVDPGAPSSYTEFGVQGAGSTNAPLDDVGITLSSPFSPPAISFSTNALALNEDAGTVTGTVSLAAGYPDPVGVDLAVTGGNTVYGQDYTNYADETLVFAPGELSKTFTFDMIDDTNDELAETLVFGLSSFSNGVAGTYTQLTATIAHDTSDVQPDIYFASASDSVLESAGAQAQQVYLSKTYSGTVTVQPVVTGGSADSGDDYTYTPTTLTFTSGDTNETCNFTIVDDPDTESAETIIFGLGSIGNASAGTPSNYTVTIESDPTDWSIPFSEDFESRTLGDLDGQYGWEADAATVQNTNVHAGLQAGSINVETGIVSHVFGDGETKVWTDLWIKPVFGEGHDSVTNPPAGSSFAFYVNTSSNVVAFDGLSETQLTATVTSDTWARFTVRSDYGAKTWDLFLNGVRIQQDLGFFHNGAASYTEFGVRGSGASIAPVDDINITVEPPGYMAPTLFIVR